MKILITGGHITPAIAVIEELKKSRNVEIVMVGRKYSQVDEKAPSFEYAELKRQNIRFINLKTGRLNRKLSISTLINLILFARGLLQSQKIVGREKPDKILSFGGYLALPIAIAGYFRGILVYTHEQTLVPGLSNRIIGWFAKNIFVAFPQTRQYFPSSKTIISGNPIRSTIFKASLNEIKLPHDRPIIFVTGGSMGAHAINIHIEAILPELLNKYTIVHQTGNVKKYDDFSRLSKLNDQNYLVRQHFSSEEMGSIYQQASLIISRAGANTIFELIKLRKPAVLIPLPGAAAGEQQAHAELLEKAGVAKIFNQRSPSDELLELIKVLINDEKSAIAAYSLMQTLVKDDAAIIIKTILLA